MSSDSGFSRLDIAFSQFLADKTSLKPAQKTAFKLLCARLSQQQSMGHSCLGITSEEQVLVKQSGVLSADNSTALVLENNRLYLQRYWFYENRLALQISALLLRTYPVDSLDVILSRYFIDLIDETDWQREAVKKAVRQAFSIITGGPGTGKTKTIVKMLAILQELAEHPLHIALAAPTGKAAMRLQESIVANIDFLPCSEMIKNQIPVQVNTLHFLLGAKVNSPFFKHNSHFPLSYDLVVVDEVSMVDLALMSKLVDALKPQSRLIILGDKDQLSSVESGAILADLTKGVPTHTHRLTRSYRFQEEIKALADAVNAQAVDEAWQLLENNSQQTGLLDKNLMATMVEGYQYYFQCIGEEASLSDIFSAFNEFQVLCSNRYGERGVVLINDKLEKQLLKQKNIQFLGQWYIGRPVIVMENSPHLQLFNGDVGICLHDKELNKLFVFFQTEAGKVRKVSPARMPVHETVFAMTIHKSQGSEFAECLCVIADQMSPVLTKELLYTAITRAKEKLILSVEYTIFRQTLEQKVVRMSGLCEKLRLE